MEEIWKDIKGYEGLYQVSNFGRIKGMEKICKSCYGSTSIKKERILKNRINNKNGYYRVTLYKEDGKKDFYVHRLVAETFIPNIDNKPAINHKDGDKGNNNVDNLEWVTYKENTNHAWKTKLIVMTEKHKNTNIENGMKLAKKVIQYDRQMRKLAEYNSLSEAGRINQIKESGISRCCRGLIKQAGGYIWRYKEE